MKKALMGAVLAVGFGMAPVMAQAAGSFTNYGFEQGLTGWSVFGNVSQVSSDPISASAPAGSFMAKVDTFGGLNFGEASGLTQIFTPLAAPLRVFYNFASVDYVPFDDRLEMSWRSATAQTGSVSFGVADLTAPYSDGSLRSSGWQSFILPAGTTSFSAVVSNKIDRLYDSYALLDIAPVPEPSEWLMLGVGLLAIGAVARRRMRS